MSQPLCTVCGTLMNPVLREAGDRVHPTCDKVAMGMTTFAEPATPAVHPLKLELTTIIKWAETNSPRSQQVSVGPSELGDPCDRRLGMRMAGLPPANENVDSWPATVGTAIHDWTDAAVRRYQDVTGARNWLTNVRVAVDGMISGSSDLYHIPTGTVVDLKTSNADVLKKMTNGADPPDGYKIQIQAYGKGYVAAGIPVNRVALIFVPRSGWLRQMHVWEDEYRPEVADAALARLYDLGSRLIREQVAEHPHRWNNIEATPSRMCGWCPFLSIRDADRGADQTGCPGR